MRRLPTARTLPRSHGPLRPHPGVGPLVLLRSGLFGSLLCGLLPLPAHAQDAARAPTPTRAFATSDRMIFGTAEELTAGVSFADVDGDGDPDVIFANGRHWAQLNEVWLNNGRGQFTMAYALGPEKATSYAVPAGDLDGDGDLDVVAANDRAESHVYLNDGTGRFALAWPLGPAIEPTRSAQLHDLDGDGALDLLVTNRGTPNGFHLNDGTGRFGPKRAFGDPDGSTIAVAVADLDLDGDPDLVLANRDRQPNQVLLNDGQLNFTPAPGTSLAAAFGTGSDETRAVVVADFDGDGIPDIAAGNIGEPNAVHLGRGDGTFRPGVPFGADERTYALAVADVDADGDPDLVAANVGGPNAVYLNDGTGAGWAVEWLDGPAADSYGVAAADLDGDGFPEIVFANSGAHNRLYMNVPTPRPGRAP